ncbi:lysine N(6)-hydroxylase/L-ornithine N(5)-oxygenase family protein [Actinosynnema sp. NPDC091369]
MAHQDVDIVAIGAGPSNLALGVALEELAPTPVAQRTLVLEQHSDVRWQRNLLLPWAESQVSFLKDLVTLRNPRSRFTFLNFLHEQGRLDEFINLSTFTPYRTEISAYLQWVADTLEHVRISYDRRCTSIEPRRAADGSVEGWLVTTADGDTVSARDLVVGTGRDPHVPEVFSGLPADRVVHSTGYLEGIAALPKDAPHRVVVVGGAQSAAEMFRSVHDDLPHSRPTIVMRSIGFGHYQTSKFINELYYPSFIDEFHQARPEARARILREMRQTNYAGLAPGLLEELYRMRYLQRLAGQERSRVLTLVDVVGARLDGDDIVLDLEDSKTGAVEELRCDVVLLGTGFDPRPPRLLRALMEPLGRTELTADRGYRVDLGETASAALYLQGVNEETHGISDSLLSVLAQRSRHIVDDILDRRRPRSNGAATRLVTTGGSV